MSIELINFLIILIILIVSGVLISIVNLKKTPNNKKSTVNKEQITWQIIDELNEKKKELIEKKKELSYKYTAKTIDDNKYSVALKKLNEEIKNTDNKINAEVSKLTNIQKQDNTQDDLRFKNLKIKGQLNELKLENENLNEKIVELEQFIKELSKNSSATINETEQSKIKYYTVILNKYKDEINKAERKTITEMKQRIIPNDLTIKNIISKFTPIAYDFNKDYIPTLKKVYNYLKSEISIIDNDVDITYYLSFTEILKEKIADAESISILLCSIMQALQDSNAKIEMNMLEQQKVHPFVSTKYKNTYYIFDLVQKIPFDMFKNTDMKELYKNYSYKNLKIVRQIYWYNQNDYEENNN